MFSVVFRPQMSMHLQIERYLPGLFCTFRIINTLSHMLSLSISISRNRIFDFSSSLAVAVVVNANRNEISIEFRRINVNRTYPICQFGFDIVLSCKTENAMLLPYARAAYKSPGVRS